MNFVKRKANTKAKITVDNFAKLKYNFLSDIQAVVDMEEVHTTLSYYQLGPYCFEVCTSWIMDNG